MKRWLLIAYLCVFLFFMTAGALLLLLGVINDIVSGETLAHIPVGGQALYARWDTRKLEFIFYVVVHAAIALALLSCVPAVTRGLLKKIRNGDA